jgi:hypothetical protein
MIYLSLTPAVICLHLQGRKVSETSNKQSSATGLHGFVSQKVHVFKTYLQLRLLLFPLKFYLRPYYYYYY